MKEAKKRDSGLDHHLKGKGESNSLTLRKRGFPEKSESPSFVLT